MTRSQSTIPFHKLRFNDDLPSLRYIEDRLRRFLKRTRRHVQEQAVAQGRMSEDDCLDDYELIESADLSRIKHRACHGSGLARASCICAQRLARHLVRSIGLGRVARDWEIPLGTASGASPRCARDRNRRHRRTCQLCSCRLTTRMERCAAR